MIMERKRMNIPSMPTTRDDREVSRLLSAAVVNQKFCRLLLSNPATALAKGYHGESFRLGKEERDLILSIRANDLAEFARQLAEPVSGNKRIQRASLTGALSL